MASLFFSRIQFQKKNNVFFCFILKLLLYRKFIKLFLFEMITVFLQFEDTIITNIQDVENLMNFLEFLIKKTTIINFLVSFNKNQEKNQKNAVIKKGKKYTPFLLFFNFQPPIPSPSSLFDTPPPPPIQQTCPAPSLFS